MNKSNHSFYEYYLPWKPWSEAAFWIAKCSVAAMLNSATVIMEFRRVGDQIPAWRPMTWEWTSNLVILAMVPLLVGFTRRYALHWDSWRRYVPIYLLASVLFSLLHVFGMVALRKAVYALHGEHYGFGHWPTELLYEYIKDAQSFIGIVTTMHVYRWLIRRLQGEASLLWAADEGMPAAIVVTERPERFLVRKLNREFLIVASEIDWVQASGNYVNLHVGGRIYPLRSTMAIFETQLEPLLFIRVHRSFLVNINQITSIEPLDSGDARIHLKDGSVVACSRRYRESLRLK